jgi:hypothetical protein
MKIFNIKYSAIATGLLVLVISLNFSCKKALDNNLENATYEGAYWKSESDINGAALGGYALLRRSLFNQNAFFLWGDAPAGLFNSDATNDQYPYNGRFRIPYKENGTQNWTNWYQVVGQSNLILAKTAEIDERKFAPGRKNYLLGEAYFLRALSYFYMTRVWGDLPLQLEAVTTADQAKLIGRTDASQIMKQVLSDATKASALLTWEGLDGNQRFRASKAAALALLAHAYAWNSDYEKTVLYTDSIINRPDLLSLQPKGSIRDVFANTNAKENIFVITNKYSNNEASGYDPNIANSIAYITISSDLIKGMPSSNPTYWLVPAMLSSIYTKDDTRLTEFVGYRNATDVKPNLMKYKDIQNVGSGGTFDMRAESNLVVFRLADMILLKAEALNALSRDGEARFELNKIRQRAGVADLNNSGLFLKRDIFQERERELIGEGHTYFDMVRTGRAYGTGGVAFFPPWMTLDRFRNKGYLWPIDNGIVNTNRLIGQNQWWQNN